MWDYICELFEEGRRRAVEFWGGTDGDDGAQLERDDADADPGAVDRAGPVAGTHWLNSGALAVEVHDYRDWKVGGGCALEGDLYMVASVEDRDGEPGNQGVAYLIPWPEELPRPDGGIYMFRCATGAGEVAGSDRSA